MAKRNQIARIIGRMAYLKGNDREVFVKNTFSEIAPRYVFMNHLMTGGMDILLRKETIRRARLKAGEVVLDIGSGTGDLAREAQRAEKNARITATDINLQMILAANHWAGIDRSLADALQLPFADEQFDLVMSGYLVRNLSDLQRALQEQYRVLKPGGRILVLDMTRPRHNFFTPFINIYFRLIIPFFGAIFNRNRKAYTYLIQSTENFVTAENLRAQMQDCGFEEVHFHIRMLGTMAIHSGRKAIS